MTITSGSICVGRCYATPVNEVRKILEITGDNVKYVARGKPASPSWDKQLWRTASREAFAREVTTEVTDDWHAP